MVLDAISLTVAFILICDIIFTTIITDGLPAVTTCQRCNKKFCSSVLIAIFLQTIHRCDDNLV